MAGFFTPTSRNPGGIPNLKLTPSNSPVFISSRTNGRSPSKTRPAHSSSNSFSDCVLSLKRVIGCSTTAFDSHPGSRSFAYTAGAAAVVVHLDDDLQITQRFFRARPNAPTLASAGSSAYPPGTPTGYAQETRNRTAASLREAGIGYSSSSKGADDSPSSKTWTARERIKAATCISFSPDGQWLAVGETGYNPRILIFSMSKDVPSDLPVAAMSEHTFGVRDVAFSPCSKYLASIGTMNDGFVYIWALNSGKGGVVRLHSSNKCTSYVRQIAWMGKSLVTVGTRHVKIWRTEENQPVSPGPKVLHGRNALLGSMSDCVMTCVVGISEDKALVCSERGDICLLDESGFRFSKVANAEFGVSCITVDAESKFAWVAGKHGNIRALVLKEIVPSTPPESPSSSRSGSPILPFGCRPANVLAMASMLGHLFTLDSNHSLKIINMSTVDGVPVPNSLIRELPAHKDSCLGVRLLPPNHSSGAAFYTWSAGGVVLFWNLDGSSEGEFQVELEQPETDEDAANELKVVRVSKHGEIFVTGDKWGVLRVIDGETRECLYDVKAHSAEIMDIAVHEGTIASCARDRTVQVFSKIGDDWMLSQTLDEHTASVSRILLLENGNKLLSCSADRTIVVRELCRREAMDGSITAAYLPVRTLITKASPVHMTPVSDNASSLMVSTMDRQIQRFDVNTGKSVHCFKATDESGDAVVMDAITLSQERGPSNRPRIMAGISTTDKSIRLYDLNGNFIDKEWGHTEGVSDVALLEIEARGGRPEQTMLISTGTDGTIMIWDFMPKSAETEGQNTDTEASAAGKEMTATRTPLRRVLSRSELLDFSQRNSRADTTTSTPISNSVSSTSPPRLLRKKTSSFGLNARANAASTQTPMQTPMQTGLGTPPAPAAATGSDESISPSTPLFNPAISGNSRPVSRKSARDRTPSPPSNKPRAPPPSRRTSHDSRVRGKSVSDNGNGINGAGSMNNLAESLARSLRSFRRKIDTVDAGETVRPEVLRDLQKELGLTAKELVSSRRNSDGNKTPSREIGVAKDNANMDLMAQLLDQYSERLVSLVHERLEEKLSRDDARKPVESTGDG